MTQDPKKLPSWLKGNKQTPETPPPSEPPPSETAGDDADVPPWLRDEQPPAEAPKVRRVAPPPDREGTGSLPPWLAGAEADGQPKSYKIGGAELSEEYFAAADSLADTTDSGMTFDAWMADQTESKREKDIEEEVPGDLMDAIANEPPAPKGTGMLKATGQLPDWFLGLESLDTTEAPEWFANEDAAAAPSAAAPLWMSDMMNEPADDPEDELPPADEIGSFFNSIGGMPDDEEEAPEIDWYDQHDLPDDAGQTLGDDFFSNLVAGNASGSDRTPPSAAYTPSYDDFADDFDLNDDAPSMTPAASGAVDIPQNELDAFFSDVASEREAPAAEPVSLDDIEDPDLEWMVEAYPTTDDIPEPYVPPDAPEAFAQESTNWLSELQGIVAGATRPLNMPPEEDFSRFGTQNLTPDVESASAAASAAAEEFSWPAPHVDETPEPAAEQEADWLSGITPSDEAPEAAELPDETVIAPRSRLTERLYRDAAPVEDAASEWESLTSATGLSDEAEDEGLFASTPSSTAQDDALFGGEIDFGQGEPQNADEDHVLASELQTGWLRQDLFAEEETPTESTPATEEDDFFSRLANDANANLLSEEANATESGWSNEQALSEADFMNALDFGDEAAAPTSQELYDPWNAEPQAAADTQDDEFFAALDFGDDANATPTSQEVYDPWQAELAKNADAQEQPAAANADEDIFAALGMNDAQPDDASSEFYDPWQTNASLQENDTLGQTAATEAGSEDDDFFAAMGFEDVTPAEPASQNVYDPWQTEPAEEEPAAANADEDIFAALGMNNDEQSATTADQELYDPWQTNAAPPEESNEEAFAAANADEDIFAALGMNDDAQPATNKPTAGWQVEDTEAASEDGLFAWQETQADDETLVAAADDFFASLGADAGDAANAEAMPDLFDSWEDEQAEAGNEWSATPDANSPQPVSEADDFFASLGMDNENAALGFGEDASMPDFFQQADAQPSGTGSDSFGEVPDDFFSVLDIGGREDETPTADLPNDDLFAQWQAEPDAEPSSESIGNDDFFAALGIDNPDSAVQSVASDDPAGDNPFANWDTGANNDIPPSEDFFAALGTMGEESPDEWAEESAATVDFFSSLTEQKPPPPAFTDVDDYLASLGDAPTADMLGETRQPSEEIDLDKLFADATETPKAPSQAQLDMLPGADEDWLAQMHTSVGEVSASAILRQKEDRPVEELSERLQKLRQRTEDYSEGVASDNDALSLAPDVLVSGTPGLGQDVALTAEQEKQVALLRALVPSDAKRQDNSRMSAIEATYDSPYMPDLEDTAEATLQPATREKVATPKRRTRRRRKLNLRVDRFIVALVLGAAVLLPFIVPGFRIGSLPPANFAAGSNGQAAFDQIEALESGDLVLVGVEYGSSSAAELDGMTEALLRHIILRGAYPVLISSNPVGLLRSESRLNAINQDIEFLRRVEARQPLLANSDYYIVRYLPGSVIGLRAFSGDTANLLLSDIHGQATNLIVRSMSDFALVTVVTDRAEDLRAYAEQIAPLTRAPLLSAVSYSAAPLVEPYAAALDGGLLIGYADAYTYTDLLDGVEARSIANRVRIVPTLEPTQPPAESGTDAEATQPAARATGIRATPTIAATPTPVLDTATVNSDAPANMRIGPGTENPVLATVSPGTTLPVLGFNADRTWVNVALEDGRTGWISATLLTITEAQSAAPKLEMYGKRQEIDEGEEQTPTPRAPTATRVFPTLAQTATDTPDDAATPSDAEATEESATATPRATRTALPTATATERPTAESTAEPSEEATIEATVEVTEAIAAAAVPPPPPSPGYRDERWYAMNLGVIASALIITLGMVINLMRGLLRRGRRG